MRIERPRIEALEGVLPTGEHSSVDPALVELVARGIASIAVVQARGTAEGRRARAENIIRARDLGSTSLTDLLNSRLAEGGGLFRPRHGEGIGVDLEMGPYREGLNVGLSYWRTVVDGRIPLLRVGLNASTGEARLHTHPHAPIDASRDVNVAQVPGMLDALATDLRVVQYFNEVESFQGGVTGSSE